MDFKEQATAKALFIKFFYFGAAMDATYEYRKNNRYFAQVSSGLESIAEDELVALGAKDIQPGVRGLHFSADKATLYLVNYKSRLLSRVLAPLVSFTCRDREDLYRAGRSIQWDRLFSEDNTFAIFSNVSGNENLRHSKFAALCLKDAAADFFRGKFGKRPDVDVLDPDVSINLHIQEQSGTIGLDVSGGALHRRGYRLESVAAPMRETIAAAVVAFSGWNGVRPLYDPMCGSGTLLCEALMKARNIPAGYLRKNFGFRFLPDFDAKLWEKIKKETDAKISKPVPGLVSGSDADIGAVKATRANLNAIPGGDSVRVERSDFRKISGLGNTTILCNPPYGVRLKDESGLDSLYKDFGDFLKQRCKGSQAFVYFGNREMIKKIGLRTTWKKELKNANLDGRLAKYELF